jgi:hypothetical protein
VSLTEVVFAGSHGLMNSDVFFDVCKKLACEFDRTLRRSASGKLTASTHLEHTCHNPQSLHISQTRQELQSVGSKRERGMQEELRKGRLSTHASCRMFSAVSASRGAAEPDFWSPTPLSKQAKIVVQIFASSKSFASIAPTADSRAMSRSGLVRLDRFRSG